jgi:hypothetical protein
VNEALKPLFKVRDYHLRTKRATDEWWEAFEMEVSMPFPETLAAAQAEATYRTNRAAERTACAERGSEASRLSFGCIARRLLIGHAVREGLRGRQVWHKWDEEHSVPGVRHALEAVEYLRTRRIDADITDIDALQKSGADVQFELQNRAQQ